MRALINSGCSLAILAVLTVGLAGCSGGDDSSTSGNDVSVAYVKRPDSAMGNPTDSVVTTSGGDLYIRDKSSPSSSERNVTGQLTNGAGDVSDPEVSYDGKRILFAMRCGTTSALACLDPYSEGSSDTSWNIWEYDLNNRTFTRIIRQNSVASLGNDVDPAYLPGGKIVFTSTRQASSRQTPAAGGEPGAVGYLYTDEYEREPVTVLHVMNYDGTDIKQISFNQSHDRNPTVLATGEIMYSRWDHVGGRNQFSIFKINPDGSDYFVLYGAHSPGNSYLHPRPMADGRVISTVMPLSGTSEGGSLEIIDIANYSENDDPADGVGTPNQLGRREGQFQATRLMNTGASDSDHNAMRGMGVSPLGRYMTPYPLYDGSNRVLVAYTPSQPTTENNTFVGTRTVEGTPRYGIWMLNLDRGTLNVVVLPQAGYMYSDPVALQARPEPAPKAGSGGIDPTLEGAGLGLLNVKSVYDTDGRQRMGNAVLAAGESIPVSGTPSRPDLNSMKTPGSPNYASRVARFFRITKAVATPNGLSRETIGEEEFEMQQIIGYGVIEPDGSMTAKVPANTPVTITVLDSNVRDFTHHTNWIQVRPGETRTCNGCHSPRRGSALNGAGVANNHPLATPGGSESMSETRFNNGNPIADLKQDPDYVDFWTGAYNTANGTAIAAGTPIAFNYGSLGAIPSPVVSRNGATCNGTSWDPVNCAIVINYEDHIQPMWDAHCVGCHTASATDTDLDLTPTRSGVFGRFNSYQELLVGDPVICTNPASTNPPCTVGLPIITINGDGDIRIQREPSLVNGGNARSSHLIERMYEQELLATGTVCADDGAGGCTNGKVNHRGMLNSSELRLLSEWTGIGAQYYNSPFVPGSTTTVRSVRGMLNEDTFRTEVWPILMNTVANGGADCAGCHRAFGGNGSSTGPANTAFQANRFVLTGSFEGDLNATASMINNICNPTNSYLLSRPASTLADNPPHPGSDVGGAGPAVLPAGSPMYNTILSWIQNAGATICSP